MVSDTERAIVHRIQAAVIEQQSKKQALQRIPVEAIDTQLEAWKATPADQAMRELAQLSRNQGMEPAEKRIELEIIRTKADIMGALVPQQVTGNNIVAIKFVMPENTQMKPVVDVQCR